MFRQQVMDSVCASNTMKPKTYLYIIISVLSHVLFIRENIACDLHELLKSTESKAFLLTEESPLISNNLNSILYLQDASSKMEKEDNLMSQTTFGRDFIASQAYDMGMNPTSVDVSDINGDGILDVIVSNWDGNSGTIGSGITSRIGNGDGTFRESRTLGEGIRASFVKAGDLNDDGFQDLAVLNFDNDSVSIFRGKGDGTFNEAVDYIVGDKPFKLVGADFNEDGILDLSVTNYGGNNISVLIGNGDGTFKPPYSFNVGIKPTSITADDFNGDNNIDLVVTNFVSNTISILIGNGDGTFQTKVDVAVGVGPFMAATGDFNKDSFIDVAITNMLDDDIYILYGKGNGFLIHR